MPLAAGEGVTVLCPPCATGRLMHARQAADTRNLVDEAVLQAMHVHPEGSAGDLREKINVLRGALELMKVQAEESRAEAQRQAALRHTMEAVMKALVWPTADPKRIVPQIVALLREFLSSWTDEELTALATAIFHMTLSAGDKTVYDHVAEHAEPADLPF